MYRYDASPAVEVQRAHPGRIAIVKPVDPDDPAVADVVADWKQTPGAVGIRIILTKEAKREPNDPGLDRIARERAFVQDLDPRALDEAELEQAVLDLGGRQPAVGLADLDRLEAAAESARRLAQWQALRQAVGQARVSVHRRAAFRHRPGSSLLRFLQVCVAVVPVGQAKR